MAKKFALVQGIHNIFDYQIQNDKYIYNISRIQKNELVDKNTVGFYIVDNEDVNRYIGDHKITEKDRFIITQNDVFSLYGSLETEIEQPDIIENTWRPVLINDEYIDEPFNIDYKDGELTKANHIIENVFDTTYLTLKYDIDKEALINFLKENLDAFVELPNVGNGELTFNVDKTTVFTANSVEIDNPDYNEEDPNSPQTIKTHNIDIDQNTIGVNGSFTANSVDNKAVTIKYKGTADRVDWFVENETRDDKDSNNSSAKKLLYIECLQEYFNPSSNYPFLEIKDPNLISQDSIVFITCGSIIKETELGTFRSSDAEIFDNPEYTDGARFIWTQNMMFSANTWLPIFTRETSAYEPESITPVIGNSPYGGRLIIQGADGIIVDNNINDTLGTHDRIITISGKNIEKGIAGGLSLENGKATKVQDISEGKRIDVKIESVDTTYEPKYEKTVVETINTNKNFIRIKENPDNPNDSWLEVNGIDSKSIIIEEEIPIGGTIVGDNVITSGSFNDCDNKIPVGMSLHEVLYRILFKEKEEEGPGGVPADIFSQTLKINNKNLNINAWYYDESKPNNKGNSISSGAQLPIGTKVIIEISYSATAEENVILQFTPYGVETEPELIVGENVRAIETPTMQGAKAYKEVYSPGVECVLTTEINGFNEIETIEAPGKNTYIVEITQNGVNTITATNSITASQDSIFERHQIWRLSNFGNRWLDDPNFIATTLSNETDIINRNFTLNALLPYFIGVYKPQAEEPNYFDFESATDEEIKNEIIGNVKDSTDVAVGRCGYMRYDEAPTTDAVTFTPNNLFNINNGYGPAQLVFVIPKSALNSSATLNNWIILRDDIMSDITTSKTANLDYLFKPVALFSDEEDYYIYTNFNKVNGKGLGKFNFTYQFKNIK